MPNDCIVSARIMLQAQLELQRLGPQRVLEQLEAREPDLAEVIMEALTAIHYQILDGGVDPRQARRIRNATEAVVLVSVLALRNAHTALWTDGLGKDIQARLEAPPPPSAPPDAPAA